MVLDVFVRSKSEKKDYDQNNLLFVFFLHRYGLKYWMSGTPNEVTHVCYTKDDKLLGLLPSRFLYRDDLKIGNRKILRLRRIDIRFSSFQINDFYNDIEGVDKIS
jgi:hypothetical protein